MKENSQWTRLVNSPVDMSKVSTLVYHLPGGPALAVNLTGDNLFFDLEAEPGEVCDTSEIDGVLHFFPKGNA